MTRNPHAKNNPKDWLKQFTPVDDAELGDNQRKFLESLRRQYADGRVGRRSTDGCLYFYSADTKMGYFAGLMPRSQEETDD